MEVANGPDMHMVEIHVWNKGEGGSQNFLNTLPTLTAGQALSGTAIFANLGSYPAIFDTYINVGVFWRDKPLNMVNPLWGEKGRYSFPMAGTQIPPGDHRVWNFEIAVPVNAENFTLYILCDLNYRDRLFVTHRKYIARAYSPTKGFFIKTDDTKDYEETE